MLFLLPALFCFFRLRSFADPSGADGYFYLKQIESLSIHLHFYYKDYSLSFFPPAALNIVLRDPLLSYQIITSCFVGATSWASWRIAQALVATPSKPKRLALAVFILSGSLFPLYLQLNLVFLKTGTATLFFLLCTDALICRNFKWSLAFALVALCCHKTMIFYVGVLAAFYFFSDKSLRQKFLPLSLGLVTIASLATVFVYPTFYAQLITNITESQESKFTLLSWSRHSLELGTLLGLLVIAFGTLWSLKFQNQNRRWILGAMAFLLFVPSLFPDSLTPSSVTSRLLLISLPIALAASAFVLGQFQKPWPLPLGAALLVGVTAWQWRPMTTLVTEWSKEIPNYAAITKSLPADATLYAPHGVEFYLADKTAFRPRSFLIGAKGPNVFRVALVGPYLKEAGHLKDDLESMSLAILGENYRLYRESDWRTIESLNHIRPLSANMLVPKPDFVADY